MKKIFSPEVVEPVLGYVKVIEKDEYGEKVGIKYKRTPLHVDYGPGPGFAPSRRVEDKEVLTNEDGFNAVGSRVDNSDTEIHLPVLDLDGGAKVQAVKVGSKAVLFAAPRDKELEFGKYGPNSLLRDVLGDNRIDVEVFTSPVNRYSKMMQCTYYEGDAVTALALRSREPGVFRAVESTQDEHGHLYIQQVFGVEDHKALLTELGSIGIIDEEWRQLAEREGMGIVRTPWTKRQGVYKRS